MRRLFLIVLAWGMLLPFALQAQNVTAGAETGVSGGNGFPAENGVSGGNGFPAENRLPAAENSEYAVSMDKESVGKYARISKVLLENRSKSVPELMIVAAKQMLGTDYVAGTLEQVPERLRVSLTQTDCILFVESCLAMALNAKRGLDSPDSLCATTQRLRYRNGKVDGYASRIHYTSEWIKQGESRGVFREITDVLSGENLSGQRFSFMSEHTDAYRQLKGNPAEVARIAQMEGYLNSFHDYYVIPKGDVKRMEHLLRDGDIVGFNSSVKGLDIAHVGLVYRKENGEIGFIHASQVDGKVVVDQKCIADYVMGRKNNDGIRIVRVK